MIVVEHEGERVTTLGEEPDLSERTGVLFAHVDCAPLGWPSYR